MSKTMMKLKDKTTSANSEKNYKIQDKTKVLCEQMCKEPLHIYRDKNRPDNTILQRALYFGCQEL